MQMKYKQRLLKVAEACRETKHADMFSMEYWAHACGTPACALGNYAARRDLQRSFFLKEMSAHCFLFMDNLESSFTFEDIARHFGISFYEAEELFSENGCGGSYDNPVRDPIIAAEYIEAFVARKCNEDDIQATAT